MKKRSILISILILSTLVGLFSIGKVYYLTRDFKESFNEFETPTELRLNLDKGVYDFYELSIEKEAEDKSDKGVHAVYKISTKTNTEDELDIHYLVSLKGENPKIIEIEEDKFGTVYHEGVRMTYVLNKNKFKSFGQFEIDKKQSVIIRSSIENSRVKKLAIRSNEQTSSFFDVMSYSLLLLLCVIGFLVSGISFLIIRRREKASC